ncbi:MAG: uncharacterized ferritin-like protein (DUF455 family) [Chlamydiales bacterium]|jgi:uncharacterized ferritin-like protein (DUF455 family)
MPEPPPNGSMERWCWDFVTDETLTSKLAPGPAPTQAGAWEADAPVRRLCGPGRPEQLRPAARAARTPAALEPDRARATLMHTFMHHELQAAELFAWAVLAFPDTPCEFRAGLVRLCGEELGHLQLYREHLERLGFNVGDFPVRDWFWERVSTCTDATAFIALQGLGLEGANLEHSARFAARFRAAGDEQGAQILSRVEHDEISHVAFALHWFEQFTGAPLDYDRWSAALPAPLTPALLQGRPLNHAARRRAGQDDVFLERLAAEPPTTRPRKKGPRP